MDFATVTNLGVAGFSIWIMYKMAGIFIDWLKETIQKNGEEVKGEREKFMKHLEDAHNKMLEIINKNTEALQENSKAFSRVMDYLEQHDKRETHNKTAYRRK